MRNNRKISTAKNIAGAVLISIPLALGPNCDKKEETYMQRGEKAVIAYYKGLGEEYDKVKLINPHVRQNNKSDTTDVTYQVILPGYSIPVPNLRVTVPNKGNPEVNPNLL